MARNLSTKTYEICKLIAQGYRNKEICDLIGCKTWTVSECKKKYPDVIAEFKGKNMDGTPLEKPAPVEPEPVAEEPEIEEEAAPAQVVEEWPKKHSIAELFQQIDALKAENAKLEEECAKFEVWMNEAVSNEETALERCKQLETELSEAKARTSLDKGKILSILLNTINETDDEIFYDYIKGFAHAVDLIVKSESE